MNNYIAIVAIVAFALVCLLFYKHFKNTPDDKSEDKNKEGLCSNVLGMSFSSQKAKQDYIKTSLESDDSKLSNEERLLLLQFILEDHIQGSKEIEIDNTGYSVCIDLDRDDIASCGMMELILGEAAEHVPSQVKPSSKKVHKNKGWTLITDHDRVEYFEKLSGLVEEVKKLLIAPDSGDLSPEMKKAFDYAVEPIGKPVATLYALTSCRHCSSTENFLEENKIAYQLVIVDKFELTYRERITQTMKQHNPRGSFPTLVCPDGKVVVGYRLQLLKEKLLNES